MRKLLGKRTTTNDKTSLGKPSRGVSVSVFTLIGVVITGVLVYCAAFFLAQLIQAQGTHQLEAYNNTAVRGISALLEGVLQQQSVSLASIARDPKLTRLFKVRAFQRMEDKAKELRQIFPYALRVRLLEPDTDQLELTSVAPLGYAALNLLRKAERMDSAPEVEVDMFGTPRQAINRVQQVRADGQLLGFILVSYDVGLLETVTKRLQFASPYVELWQDTGFGKPLVLLRQGDENLRRGQPSALHPIPGSLWKLAYWSNPPQAGIGIQDGFVFWLVFTILFLTVALLMALLHNEITQRLHVDLEILTRLFWDIRNQRFSFSYPVRLRPTAATVQSLLAAASIEVGPAVSPAAKPQAPAVSEPSAGKPGVPSAWVPPVVVEPNTSDIQVVGTVPAADVSPSIFRAYDIRGRVDKTLTPNVVYHLGHAIGSEAYARGQQSLVVARDGRHSGAQLLDALVRGLCASGRDVINIGLVPTPVLYFATEFLDAGGGVMLTGSHYPPQYNGLKIVLGGESLSEDNIQMLRKRIESDDFLSGEGKVTEQDVLGEYVQQVMNDVRLAASFKVIVDCGNGAAGVVARQLLEELGCTVIPLFCEVDGTFPHHPPDPSDPENLRDLIDAVKTNQADLGLAFDGDGDRLGVVDTEGKIIWPDQLLMLFAMDVLVRNPGTDVVFDIKCTRHLPQIISKYGGRPLMWKSGHALIEAKMRETGALLAGEMSGHIMFKERWYGFDDALYAAARLLEILAMNPGTPSETFATLSTSPNTPELCVPMEEGTPFELVERLVAGAQFPDGQINTIDGLRVDFPDGWGLVRASNTRATLVMRFEANTPEALRRIQDSFKTQLLNLAPHLALPF
jgi:phosphomannomutase/phosphoglucomutase